MLLVPHDRKLNMLVELGQIDMLVDDIVPRVQYILEIGRVHQFNNHRANQFLAADPKQMACRHVHLLDAEVLVKHNDCVWGDAEHVV